MARIAGVTIERNAYGTPKYVRIDLKRYGNQLVDFFSANNIEVEKSKWSAKMKNSIKQAENGEVYYRTLDVGQVGRQQALLLVFRSAIRYWNSSCS